MRVFVTLFILFIFLPVRVNAEFQLGIGTHIYEQDMDKNILLFKEINSNSIREDLNWKGVERDRGKQKIPQKIGLYLTKSSEAHINSLMILCYGNPFYDGGKKLTSQDGIAAFTRFAGFSAKQLKDKANIFEIWNEWDHSEEPNSPESYFKLVKATAPVIRSENKNAVVIAGTATTAGIRKGWVEQLVKLGVLNYVDGISIHPYIHCEGDKSPEAWIKFIEETSRQLQKANGGKSVPLYITEMGWPSNNGECGTTPDIVAQYLARALLLVRTLPEVKGFWWYDLKNDGDSIENREHNFGLLNYDYSLKPAFNVFRDVSKFVINAKSVERQTSPKGIISLVITDNTGKKTFTLWTDNSKTIDISISIEPERAEIPLIMKVGTGKSYSINPNGSTLNLVLDGTPRILIGIQNIKISKINQY